MTNLTNEGITMNNQEINTTSNLKDPRGQALSIEHIGSHAGDCVRIEGWGYEDYELFQGYMSQYITNVHIFTEGHWNYTVLKCNALKNGFKFK